MGHFSSFLNIKFTKMPNLETKMHLIFIAIYEIIKLKEIMPMWWGKIDYDPKS